MALGKIDSHEAWSPHVTVIIPTRDRTELVVRAVRSVLAQTYSNYEVIVVDDASDNPAAPVLSSLAADPRVMVIRRSTNGGVSAARNEGLRVAAGEYICFLDDDDWYFPEKLQTQVELLNNSGQEIVGVVGRCAYASGKPDMVPPSVITKGSALKMSFSGQIGAYMFRATALKGVEFDESLRAWEDVDFFLTVLENSRIRGHNDTVSVYGCDAGERLTFDPDWPLSLERVFDRHVTGLTSNEEVQLTWRKRLALGYLEHGRPAECRRHVTACLRMRPLSPRLWVPWMMTLLGPNAGNRLINAYRGYGEKRSRAYEHSQGSAKELA